MKVIVFNANNTEALETKINDWLDGVPGAIISQIAQSESGSLTGGDFYINLTVFYTDGS